MTVKRKMHSLESVCVCVCVCVRARVCVCVRVRALFQLLQIKRKSDYRVMKRENGRKGKYPVLVRDILKQG